MFYLTVVSQMYITVTLGWHDSNDKRLAKWCVFTIVFEGDLLWQRPWWDVSA